MKMMEGACSLQKKQMKTNKQEQDVTVRLVCCSLLIAGCGGRQMAYGVHLVHEDDAGLAPCREATLGKQTKADPATNRAR
jgi:hypothetical protein